MCIVFVYCCVLSGLCFRGWYENFINYYCRAFVFVRRFLFFVAAVRAKKQKNEIFVRRSMQAEYRAERADRKNEGG